MSKDVLLIGCGGIGLERAKKLIEQGYRVLPCDEDAEAEMAVTKINGNWATDWADHYKRERGHPLGDMWEWFNVCNRRDGGFVGAWICPPYEANGDIRLAALAAGIDVTREGDDGIVDASFARDYAIEKPCPFRSDVARGWFGWPPKKSNETWLHRLWGAIWT